MDRENFGELQITSAAYPVLAQVTVGFAFGMMLSPYSTGIFFVIGFMLAYELLVLVTTRGKEPYWDPVDRAGVVAAYLTGWICGRALAGFNDVFSEVPQARDARGVQVTHSDVSELLQRLHFKNFPPSNEHP